MKKLMILGAGIYQVPLIQTAKRMGLSTIVVSYPGPYPGFALGDTCLYLDTRDKESILKASGEMSIDGICTTGTDVAVISLGYVADALGLSGLSEKAARNVTDKFLMRSAFRAGGVRDIPFQKITSLEEAYEAFDRLGSPMMLKAVDSSGSRGINKVSISGEVAPAFEAASSVTKMPYILAEKFVEGREIGVDGFIQDGVIKLFLPHEKEVVYSGNAALPGGHRFPYAASSALLTSIRQEISRAVTATGLDNCAFNADVMVHGEEAFLLEIGGRCGATCIPELISLYCGFDYYEKIILSALGEKPNFDQRSPTPCMARLLFSPVDGIITGLDGEKLEQFTREGLRYSLDYGIGSPVERVKNGTDRIGQVILPSSSPEELENLCGELYGAIFVNGIPLSKLWAQTNEEHL